MSQTSQDQMDSTSCGLRYLKILKNKPSKLTTSTQIVLGYQTHRLSGGNTWFSHRLLLSQLFISPLEFKTNRTYADDISRFEHSSLFNPLVIDVGSIHRIKVMHGQSAACIKKKLAMPPTDRIITNGDIGIGRSSDGRGQMKNPLSLYRRCRGIINLQFVTHTSLALALELLSSYPSDNRKSNFSHSEISLPRHRLRGIIKKHTIRWPDL